MEENIKRKKQRNLKDLYLILYIVKNEVNVLVDNKVIIQDLYVITGTDILGNRTVLNIAINNKSNNRFWLDMFEDFKARGIKRIFFISAKEDGNITRAMKIVFPDSILVFSLANVINNIYKYVGIKGKNSISKQIKDLCILPSFEQFSYKVDLLKEQYSNNYVVNALIDNMFEFIKKTYEYDESVRKLLFNHNKVLEFYDRIKRYQTNSYIKNVDEIWTFLWDFILVFEQNKSFSKNAWTKILNSLTKKFDKEIIEAIKE